MRRTYWRSTRLVEINDIKVVDPLGQRVPLRFDMPGLVGAVLVFDTRKKAEAFDFAVVELNDVDRGEL